ncbi:hypothetical protein QUA04_07070 [Microcoleus sp. S13_C5]
MPRCRQMFVHELQAGRPCHDAGRCFFTIGDRLHIAAAIYCFSRTLDLRSHGVTKLIESVELKLH